MESRFVRRRTAARERNTCTVCLRRPALDARTVCGPCNEEAKVRVRTWRQRKARAAVLRRTLLSQESAGDHARTRNAYPEALGHYEEALRCSAIEPDDDRRLSEKYASALFFGREPEQARMWFERALEGHRIAGISAENAVNAGTLLLRLSRQYWLNAATVSALPLISEAIRLGTLAGNDGFFARANLAMAHYLILLGRHQDAQPFFDRARMVPARDQPEMQAVSLAQRAILYAAQGDRQQAARCFDSAVDAARELPDGYQVTAVWDDFGLWAMALGDIRTAQLCRERAVFVAHERHIAWRIAYLSLRYADLLLELEQYEHARELLLDALTYDSKTPCITILTASVGTRLALALDDRALLQRCSRDHAIEYAFQSGEPARIGPLASALVRMHLERGERDAATTLLRRGLSALLSADHAWDLLLDAATLGTEPELLSSRALLQARAALPHGAVAEAYLTLFDAAVAMRRGHTDAQRRHGKRASERFQQLGWLAQQRLARSYAGEKREAAGARGGPNAFRPMLGGLTTLTKREADVAELVLKGLTNRAIARELSISEHTVESHMTSIMNRLGIRSRHQLVDMLPT